MKTVLLELFKTLAGRGVELCDKPMFATVFFVDMETDLQLLTTCFLSSSIKVWFSTTYTDKFARKEKIFHVYSNKPPMRYKKYPDVHIKDPNEPWWNDNWCRQTVKDCMLRHDKMFFFELIDISFKR